MRYVLICSNLKNDIPSLLHWGLVEFSGWFIFLWIYRHMIGGTCVATILSSILGWKTDTMIFSNLRIIPGIERKIVTLYGHEARSFLFP